LTRRCRETPEKVYVQHLLKENSKFVNVLLQKGANFYVCGGATHMAREVSHVLGPIIAQERGVDEKEAEQTVKSMQSSGAYQEDVWS
ncbi:hypothetical protein EDB80DRAFT_588981, partial [Ilyonectria destructans]